MKTLKHTIVPINGLTSFITAHIGKTYTIAGMTNSIVDFIFEQEQSVADIHMEHLRALLGNTFDLITEEEKAAIEYAIECIKTLDDMGIIKENKDND